jgi:hypothetical protein
MYTKFKVLIVLSIIITACDNRIDKNKCIEGIKQNSESKFITDTILDVKKISNLESERRNNIKKVWKAINENDEMSYKEVSDWFRFHPNQNDFMYYSIIMAYKNESVDGYWDIYRFYNRGTGICKKTDTVFFNFILYNIARANELGKDIGECDIDGLIISKKNIKSSGYYLKKLPHND